MDNPIIVGKTNLTNKPIAINTLFPESVIISFYHFVRKTKTSDVEYNPSMIIEIDQYIDKNSSRWIYNPILKSNPDSRYLVFLMHYFDRNPTMQMTINSKLPGSMLRKIEAMKKSFKLGC